MDRSLLRTRLRQWIWVAVTLTLVPSIALCDEPGCEWSKKPLGDVVTHGLYQLGLIDTQWTQSLPALQSGDRERNYRCLLLLFDRGPWIIPGLAEEFAANAKALGFEAALPRTGVDIAPAIVFMEPQRGREYLIRRVADRRWSARDVAAIAQAIWPRRAPAVRAALIRVLQDRPSENDASAALAELVRFAEPADERFISSRFDWLEKRRALRIRLAMMAKLGRIEQVIPMLGSDTPAAAADAADALLSWGHIGELCDAIRKETDQRRAVGLAGAYMEYKRGDFFPNLPRAVIEKIQRAPQVRACFSPAMNPPKWLGPRDTTRDAAAAWSPPDIGGDD